MFAGADYGVAIDLAKVPRAQVQVQVQVQGMLKGNVRCVDIYVHSPFLGIYAYGWAVFPSRLRRLASHRSARTPSLSFATTHMFAEQKIDDHPLGPEATRPLAGHGY